MKNSKVYICLANGSIFEGKRFGAADEIMGELVFTTGMGGYIETLTDPGCYGQIVMQTFPLIGNYGFIHDDMESNDSHVSAYIVREACDTPSNFRCDETLDAFLEKNNIIGVYGTDTRELTKTIRENGVMNAVICDDPRNVDYTKVRNFKITDAVKSVSVKKPQLFSATGDHNHNVVLIDYGVKNSIVRELNSLGCNVAVIPHDTKAEDILSIDPDGIILSNGPGDPIDNKECIEELKKLIGKKTIFGIGLGHQLLALAMGCETTKLSCGHRGTNQPVKNLKTGKTYISSQNHGFTVMNESVESALGVIRYINANDGTCEGIDYPDKNAFSVQFYPWMGNSLAHTDLLFNEFIEMMGGKA